MRARICCANQAHLKDIKCQMKMVSSLWQVIKIIKKVLQETLVFNISHIKLIIYI